MEWKGKDGRIFHEKKNYQWFSSHDYLFWSPRRCFWMPKLSGASPYYPVPSAETWFGSIDSLLGTVDCMPVGDSRSVAVEAAGDSHHFI